MKTFKELMEAKTVRVPKFKTTKDMLKFISSLGGNDKVTDDVYDPETGEMYIQKGQNKKQASKHHPAMDPRNLRTVSVKNKDNSFSSFNMDFKDIYKVVSASVGKIAGVSSKDVPDTDVSTKIPYLISRKDGKPISDDDIDEIEIWLDDEYEWVSGEGLTLSVSKKGRRAEISIGFY